MGLLSQTSPAPIQASSGGLLARSAPPVAPITPQPTQTSTPPVATPEQDVGAKKGVLADIFKAPDNTLLGTIKNTLMGIPKAAEHLGSNLIGGDVGQAFGNESLNATPAGVMANTALGTANKLTLGMARGISRDVAGVVGQAPAFLQKQSSFTPNDPLSKFVFGTQPVPNIYESGKNQMLSMGVGPKTAAVMGLPFGIMSLATDFMMNPEENTILKLAHDENPVTVEKTIISQYPALKEQASVLAQTIAGVKDPQQVSAMLRDALKKKTADALAAHPQNPDISYEPTTVSEKPTEPIIQQEPTSVESKTLDAFTHSTDQKQVGNFELGSFGKNSELRKATKADRFPENELSATQDHITGAYRSSDNPASYRHDNTTWVAKMPNGEDRVIYTRKNAAGKDEILNWHTVSDSKYLEQLKSFGAPAQTRTEINPIEGERSNPLSYGGESTPFTDRQSLHQPETAISSPQSAVSPTEKTAQYYTDLQTSPGEHALGDNRYESEHPSYKSTISENNGGTEPPTSRGGLRVPEIDFSIGKDKAAIDLSVNTMERNIENIFPRETASKINKFLIEPVRANEADRVEYVSDIRKQVKKEIVDGLGIHVGSKESALLQRYGEGRMNISELVKESPKHADAIIKANTIMRKVYDDLINHWNDERASAGLPEVPKRADYYRHFQDMHSFLSMFNFMAKRPELPTAISGITENFRSRVPWASAAMRRLGGPFTEDAIKGLDQYLNTTSRAIFHTDSVQRGRLFEKYLREAAEARTSKGLADVGLPNFASNLNDWVNLVSGKQSKLDRAIESVAGRRMLPFLGGLTRQFSKNVIGGSISSAITHAIPTVFTLATTDTRSAVLGLMDTLRSPFMGDFNSINGLKSGFLTRRFGTEAIEKNVLQKGSDILGSPFHAVDQFISRFAVSAKYAEGLKAGLKPEEAMAAADKYAARTIGDRSTGNLPNLMNTKTLGMITQFQIEVNDNLQVLLHDVPYDQQGNMKKVAGMYVKFAIYSYLFNQVMQNIKGSGKGLDPIDLGLTLAGLNSEGKGKDLATRAGLAAGDFAKELPFTSLPVGGQIPALEPIAQAVTKIGSGDVLGGAEQLGIDYASPIGGGVQAQKTLKGLTAVNAGEVKNAKGQLTSVVPKTPVNYVKGALFGTAAFPAQQQATKNETELYNLLQQNKSGQQTLKAIQEFERLKSIDKTQGTEAANTEFEKIKTSDPSLSKLILTQASNEKLGLTKEDLMVKQLGVGNGQRAKYLAEKFNSLDGGIDAKKALWEKYVNDKIITPQVSTELIPLLQK